MAFIIVGAVSALGFTSSGIAAGSAAASMMSAAGPVAAGSLVAVCQSIGATGAVSATTAVIANTALGGAVGGAAYGLYRRFRGDGGDDDNPSCGCEAILLCDHFPPKKDKPPGDGSTSKKDDTSSSDCSLKGGITTSEDKPPKEGDTQTQDNTPEGGITPNSDSPISGSSDEQGGDSTGDGRQIVENNGHSDNSNSTGGAGGAAGPEEGDASGGIANIDRAVEGSVDHGEAIIHDPSREEDDGSEVGDCDAQGEEAVSESGGRSVTIRVADLGEPVYNSDDELVDPATGLAVVEI